LGSKRKRIPELACASDLTSYNITMYFYFKGAEQLTESGLF